MCIVYTHTVRPYHIHNTIPLHNTHTIGRKPLDVTDLAFVARLNRRGHGVLNDLGRRLILVRCSVRTAIRRCGMYVQVSKETCVNGKRGLLLAKKAYCDVASALPFAATVCHMYVQVSKETCVNGKRGLLLAKEAYCDVASALPFAAGVCEMCQKSLTTR